jgi:hypothetical protein
MSQSDSFEINDPKAEYVIHYVAVYKPKFSGKFWPTQYLGHTKVELHAIFFMERSG